MALSFDAMDRFNRQMREAVGVLDAVGRSAQGASYRLSGMDKYVNQANKSFIEMAKVANTGAGAFKTLGAAMLNMGPQANNIKEARIKLNDFQVAASRAAVTAKALNMAFNLTMIGSRHAALSLANLTKGLDGFIDSATKMAGKMSNIFSTPEVKLGEFRTTLLDYNKLMYEVQRQAETMGRSSGNSFFNENFWSKVDKNLSIGRSGFLKLSKEMFELYSGVPIASDRMLELATVISTKFGPSLETVDKKMRRILDMRNFMPGFENHIEQLRRLAEASDFEPKGLKEAYMMIGDLGASNQSLDAMAQMITKVEKADRSLLMFEKATARHSQAAENYNVKTAQSVEDTMITIENAMTKGIDKMDDLVEAMGRVTKAMYGLKTLQGVGIFSALTQGLAGLNTMINLKYSQSMMGAVLQGGNPNPKGAMPPQGGGGSPILPLGTRVMGYAGLAAGAAVIGTKGAKYAGAMLRTGAAQRDLELLQSSGMYKNSELEGEMSRIRSLKFEQGERGRGFLGSAIGGGVGVVGGGMAGAALGARLGAGAGLYGAAAGALGGAIGGAALGGWGASGREKKFTEKEEATAAGTGALRALSEDIGLDPGKRIAIQKTIKGLEGEQLSTQEVMLRIITQVKGVEEQRAALLTFGALKRMDEKDLMLEAQKTGNSELITMTKSLQVLKQQDDARKKNLSTSYEQVRVVRQILERSEKIIGFADQWKQAITEVLDVYKQINYVGSGLEPMSNAIRESGFAKAELMERRAGARTRTLSGAANTSPTSRENIIDYLAPFLGDVKTLGVSNLNEMGGFLGSINTAKQTMANGDVSEEQRAALMNDVNAKKAALLDISKKTLSLSEDEIKNLEKQLTLLSANGAQEIEMYRKSVLAQNAKDLTLASQMRINDSMDATILRNERMVGLLEKQAGFAAVEQEFTEKLALGMAASYAMRKQVYDYTVAQRMEQEKMARSLVEEAGTRAAIRSKEGLSTFKDVGVSQKSLVEMSQGQQLGLNRAMLEISRSELLTEDQKIDAQSQLFALYNKQLDVAQRITQTKSKELDLTMQLREGFLDVINEMTTGSDLISKLIPNAERGRGQILDITRMMKGADFGGAMRVGFASMSGFGMAGTADNAARYSKYGMEGRLNVPAVRAYRNEADNAFGGNTNPAMLSGVNLAHGNLGAAGMVGSDINPRIRPGGPIMQPFAPGLDLPGVQRGAAAAGAELSDLAGVIRGVKAEMGAHGATPRGAGVVPTRSRGGSIDISSGGIIPGTPSAGRDNMFGYLNGGRQVIVGSGEMFIPKRRGQNPGVLDYINQHGEQGLEQLKNDGYRRSLEAAQGNNMSVNLGDGGFIIKRSSVPRSAENRGLLASYPDGGIVVPYEQLYRNPNQVVSVSKRASKLRGLKNILGGGSKLARGAAYRSVAGQLGWQVGVGMKMGATDPAKAYDSIMESKEIGSDANIGKEILKRLLVTNPRIVGASMGASFRHISGVDQRKTFAEDVDIGKQRWQVIMKSKGYSDDQISGLMDRFGELDSVTGKNQRGFLSRVIEANKVQWFGSYRQNADPDVIGDMGRVAERYMENLDKQKSGREATKIWREKRTESRIDRAKEVYKESLGYDNTYLQSGMFTREEIEKHREREIMRMANTNLTVDQQLKNIRDGIVRERTRRMKYIKTNKTAKDVLEKSQHYDQAYTHSGLFTESELRSHRERQVARMSKLNLPVEEQLQRIQRSISKERARRMNASSHYSGGLVGSMGSGMHIPELRSEGGIMAGGQLSVPDLRGLQATSGANAGSVAGSPESITLTGGISVDRLYLGGKVMGQDLRSDGSSNAFNLLKARSRG